MHRSAHWLRTTTIIDSAVVFRPAIPTVPWPLLLSLSTMLFVWRQQEQLLVERPQAESINRMRWHEEARRRADAGPMSPCWWVVSQTYPLGLGVADSQVKMHSRVTEVSSNAS